MDQSNSVQCIGDIEYGLSLVQHNNTPLRRKQMIEGKQNVDVQQITPTLIISMDSILIQFLGCGDSWETTSALSTSLVPDITVFRLIMACWIYTTTIQIQTVIGKKWRKNYELTRELRNCSIFYYVVLGKKCPLPPPPQ